MTTLVALMVQYPYLIYVIIGTGIILMFFFENLFLKLIGLVLVMTPMVLGYQYLDSTEEHIRRIEDQQQQYNHRK